ncbi:MULTISPECIES: phage tail protein [Arthrobacter]|uniref:Phage tail protein n=1 Tax=Arthrobacter terricola TaxID=2547396 RepID=A0A4R5KY47_9MICC|nr:MULTISPECIES: tail fiber protein [Arthrobacter]MBT8160015.1 tail fiber protein [Arthrobacter sp. GN70]TDG01020.1 phage tail protein [Arthrobacter terricola]
MSEPFLGEIRLVGFNFAPTGWALCNGQIMSISQNTALFALLGTMYGGNGVSTFALPNLQGRAALHNGQGPGLSNYSQGQVGGTETTTLLTSNLPPHTHPGMFASTNETTDRPSAGMAPAPGGSYGPPDSGVPLAPTQASGSGLPFNTMQPYLVLNYIIALQGIFPSRS